MIFNFKDLVNASNTENGKRIIENAKNVYKLFYEGKPIVFPSYKKYKLFISEGNRDDFEDDYFELRNRLNLLQLLSINSDEYLADLEEIISAICDQFTWILPAHNYKKDGKSFDYTELDLFGTETAYWLSETLFVFANKLSFDIIYRVKEKLKKSIIDVFESRSFFWETCGNNWSSVCGCAIGLTYLYVFPERFEINKERIMKSVDCYLKIIDEDGMCAEGVDYWEYGFSNFCNFYSSYIHFFHERPSVLKSDKVLKTINYLNMTKLGEKYFLPFADGGKKEHNFNLEYCTIFKNLFPENFDVPKIDIGNYLLFNDKDLSKRKNGLFTNIVGLNGKCNGLKALYGAAFYDQKEIVGIKGNRFYKNSEIYISNTDKYIFVTKCGTNHESHNHNDIGAFELIRNNIRLISDFGAGLYTYNYFNKLNDEADGRYGDEIFVCGSISHSVPIINGKGQRNGSQYEGKVLEVSDKFIKMDITKAYDGIDSLIVRYETKENGITITYIAKGFKNIVFRFVGDVMPILENCDCQIADMSVQNDLKLKPVVSEHFYLDHFGIKQKAYLLDYNYKETSEITINFSFEIKEALFGNH